MAGIQEYLDKIKNAVYGREVRQAIHDGIETCYNEGKAGATDLIARERITEVNDSLSARIDEIIAPSGEAPSAAEVTDARIGADGVTYASLGTANRTQLSNLKEDIANFDEINNKALKENGQLTVSLEFTAGFAISKTNGARASVGLNTFAATEDYIFIPFGTNALVTNAVMNAASAYGFAFYTLDKQFVAGGRTFVGVSIPDNARYIRLTDYDANSVHTGKTLTFTTAIKDIADGVANIADGVANIADGQRVLPLSFTNASAISASAGSFVNLSGYNTWAGTADYIEIPQYTKKLSTNAVMNASGAYGFAVYDENRTFIDGGHSFDDYEIPSTAKYVRLTDYNANSQHDNLTLTFYFTDSTIVGNGIQLESVIDNASLLIGSFTLNSAVTLSENQKLRGSKCTITCGDSAKIVLADGASIEGITFKGGWNPTRIAGDGTTYTSYGYIPLISRSDLSAGNTDALYGQGKSLDDALIRIPKDGSYNTKIDSCIFEGFDRLVIYAGGRRHTEKDNPIICNNFFSDCRYAVAVDGEFERLLGNEYLRCLIGVGIMAGNLNQCCEIYKCCDCGIYFVDVGSTANTAHNEITSIQLAHCGLAGVYVTHIYPAVGCTIVGSHLADAAVVGEDVNNLLFSGCRLDAYFDYDSGQHNSIICSNVGNNYLYGNELFGVPSDTQIKMNRGLGATADATVNWE